ncbi:DUF4870 domain-containing protein [Halorhodospira halochloris]|uniref:DUF4870 domain-containing protein n=1 Tax=Halorhodospira halochloris TaxID=1052 RepID=A0A0X8XCG3_HALHR|nr:DUF4870 domain-containing protein [Halorhodospira halochloris]MBK1652121.1 hypothetical protein [Halorhodospira halochloris]MCG5531015.1 DUF4870 domain-containing protein [Halorhodospira halochloris]MCG5548998.1 DUF4870 domain-containing protein [Halorhodospira halochloris]BAU58044.2 hypothetical protein HH1059_13350 [Halorhodospira halochloris]
MVDTNQAPESGSTGSPDSTKKSTDTPSREERTWGLIAHISGLASFLGPLIVWLIKREEMPFVNDQGKEALNFQINIAIAYIISMFLVVIAIGVILMPLVGLAWLILMIMGTVKANNGEWYRYPFIFRIIK